jgi:hypothetical protein
MTTVRIEDVADRMSVLDLVTQFHRSVDFKNWELLRSIVTDDVVWEWIGRFPGGSASDGAEGRDAVLGWLEKATLQATPHHHTTNHMVELAGDSAHTESYMFVADRFTLQTLAIGVLETDCVRIGGEWLVRKLRVDEQIGRAFTPPAK